LTRTIKAGNETVVYAALQSWASALGYRTIADWLAKEGSSALKQQIDLLERKLFGAQPEPTSTGPQSQEPLPSEV